MEFDLLLALLAVVLGSIIQGVSGVGGGFIMVPLLAMINMSFLPGPLIFGSLSISGLMAWRERAHIDFQATSFILIATIPGSALGAWLLSRVGHDQLGIVFGSMILFAVLVSAFGVHFPLTRITALVSGFSAGAMGASSGIGAPMVAVLYQRETGPKVRSTLAFIYTVASIMIVLALAVFGRFSVDEARLGLFLVPGFVFGYICSRPLALHFDHGATRYLVLGVSAAAAAVLLISSVKI
jgi:uncharacterized membrane protein YfcA